MPIETTLQPDQGILILDFQGKLNADSYAAAYPDMGAAFSSQKTVNILIDMRGFKGWTAEGLVADIQTEMKHRDDVARVAVVGDSTWQEIATTLTKPITAGEVKYFDSSEEKEALNWLHAA